MHVSMVVHICVEIVFMCACVHVCVCALVNGRGHAKLKLHRTVTGKAKTV